MSENNLTTSQLSRDDQALLARLRAGDPKAVAAIEHGFADKLRLFCRRVTGDAALGEDIVQDVLATCCRFGAFAAGSAR